MPWQIVTISEAEMDKHVWKQNCTPAFIEMTRKFITDKIAKKLANLRKKHGMLPGLAVPDEDFMDIDIDEDIEGTMERWKDNQLFMYFSRRHQNCGTQLVQYHRRAIARIPAGVSVQIFEGQDRTW